MSASAASSFSSSTPAGLGLVVRGVLAADGVLMTGFGARLVARATADASHILGGHIRGGPVHRRQVLGKHVTGRGRVTDIACGNHGGGDDLGVRVDRNVSAL